MPAPANDAWPVRRIFQIAATAVTAWADVHAAGDPDTWILRGRKLYVAPEIPPIDEGVVVVRGDRIARAVAAGMLADIVALDADPAADPANFAKVRCTIRGGTQIHPSSVLDRPDGERR